MHRSDLGRAGILLTSSECVDYDSMDSDGPIDDELYVFNGSKRRMPDAPAVDVIHSSGVLRNWVGGELLLQDGQF